MPLEPFVCRHKGDMGLLIKPSPRLVRCNRHVVLNYGMRMDGRNFRLRPQSHRNEENDKSRHETFYTRPMVHGFYPFRQRAGTIRNDRSS